MRRTSDLAKAMIMFVISAMLFGTAVFLLCSAFESSSTFIAGLKLWGSLELFPASILLLKIGQVFYEN